MRAEAVHVQLTRLKILLVRVATNPLLGLVVARIFHDRVPFQGLRIDTSHPLIQPRIKTSLAWGLYEHVEGRFVRQYLPEQLDVIELGSSLGVVSCQIRRKLRGDKRLICVEAIPEMCEQIVRNLALNGLWHNVEVVNAAVGTTDDSRIGFSRAGSTTGGHVIDVGDRADLMVESIGLPEIVTRYGLGDYALVSDIEGSEAVFIANGGDDLDGCLFIIIELHDTWYRGQNVSPDRMKASILSRGFALIDHHGSVCVFSRLKRTAGRGGSTALV